MKIVVLEDQPDLREELVYYLRKSGHQAQGGANGVALEQLMAQDTPELLLLDIGLPGEDGIAIANRLKNVAGLSLVMLTARNGAEDRIRSFEAGADTYLVKPVSPRELEAVIQRAEVRHKRTAEEGNGWRFHSKVRTLTAPNDHQVHLTLTEARLLGAMVRQSDRLATRRQLIEALGLDFLSYDDRRIEVSVSRLRKKVLLITGLDAPIKASRNVGYAFLEPCQLH